MDAEYLHGFYLGDLRIEPLTGRVSGRNGEHHLPPKAAEVLVCLARRAGDTVSHEDLLRCAWDEGSGSRESLSHTISQIRNVLGDPVDNPRLIQTLPRLGYRLLIEPVPVDEHTGSVVLGAENNLAMEKLGLLESLQQRGVLETGIAYLVLGWLIIQVADVVFDRLSFPDWATTFVIVLVGVGFPIAIVLSWFLEFRDGNAVLDDLSPHDRRRRRFGRTYISIVSALAAAAVLVWVFRLVDLFPGPEPPPAALATPVVPIAENSIAVLPFLNNDGSEETQVFANGLMDDVITRLSRVPGLLVSSRGDAATLEPNTPSGRVRQRLRVAMYLEGSVEIHAGQIRVIVQLIDSATGFHILSRTFDRPVADFFGIRDEITQLTVSSLRVTLPEGNAGLVADADQAPGLDTYLLYRRGADLLNQPPTADTLAAALGWFDAALSVDPGYAAAHAGKCRAFALRLAEAPDAGYVPRAEAACAEALELNPNLDIVHAALGRMYVETGRRGEAESAFDEALRINEHNVDAMLGLSEVYRLQNRPDEAEAMLHAAVGWQPGNWSTYANLAVFYYRQGRYAEAAEQFAEVVSINPAYVRAYSNLGASYMMAGDFAAALATYQQSLDVKADRLTYANLGMMNYYLGRFDDAEAALRTAIELAPEQHLSWSNLGDVLFVAGKQAEAREAYTTAEELLEQQLAVNPGDPGMQMDHAWIHAMLGERDEALLEITRALAAAPDDPYASYYEGLVYHRFGETELALNALERAVAKGYSKVVLKNEPLLSRLKNDPRFVQITKTNNEGRRE
jgi:tetratricopeptide (TPR) repeat protein/TolB-like protein/DNA-binding winged helix-turn-helix (wHTH) protein